MLTTKMMIAALLVFVPLAAAAQTSLRVVRDADGKLVGPVLGQADDLATSECSTDDPPLWVAHQVVDQWITLLMTQNAVWGTRQRVPFLFETPDCSGPVLMDAPQQENEASYTVVFDTNVYWPWGFGESRPISARGVLVRDAAECDGLLVEFSEWNLCCMAQDEEIRFAAEISSMPLAELGLRAPFLVEEE